jgi:hypothetical protein
VKLNHHHKKSHIRPLDMKRLDRILPPLLDHGEEKVIRQMMMINRV